MISPAPAEAIAPAIAVLRETLAALPGCLLARIPLRARTGLCAVCR